MAQGFYGYPGGAGGQTWQPAGAGAPHFSQMCNAAEPGVVAGAAKNLCGMCTCSSTRQPVMSYTGAGQGDFVQETVYKHIGPHSGDLAQPPQKSSSCYRLCGVGVGLLVLAALVFALISFNTPTTTTPALQKLSAGSSGLRYDCDAGMDHWELGWSEGKKHWCCGKVGKGCNR
mmetsp:Transcript_111056/g.320952  ORF Transcript_111056/g.320952 Transcript_111056/m.320952 type:complete len:173 (-) Transcript_111056:237-755(-)